MPSRPQSAPLDTPTSASPETLFPWPARWVCALLFGVTLLAYLPALSGDFLWDDAGHVTRAELRSVAGLGRIWFEPGATQQYYPLLHSAFWLEHQLWGDAPFGYHLVNLLLHAAAACLFAAVLRRLAVPGAGLAALFFALHPVGVESVAWIAEQKNTLSLVLYLSATLAYLRFAADRRRGDYALATGLFVAALLTKTVTATLPAALLVVAWWQRGRVQWSRDVVPLLPWFVLSASAGTVTAVMEHAYIGAQGADFALTAAQRGLLAGRAVWFYLGKLLWPADLVFIYPRWGLDATDLAAYVYPVALAGLLGALVWWQRRDRGPLAALLLFVGSLFPALGFFNVYPFVFSFVADHFQYLASLSLFALAAAGLSALARRWPAWWGQSAAGALLLLLGLLTWQQCGMYRDAPTLYRATLARNPACWLAHNNLASALVDAGQIEAALPHFAQALRLRPDFPEAENNLGDALNRAGRPQEAIAHFERALQRQPGYAEAHNNLGVAFMATGRAPEGLSQFREAVRLRPTYALAHRNLGLALVAAGQAESALAQFAHAARLLPDDATAELHWGRTLQLLDRQTEALPHLERALQLDPDNPAAHHAYGRALARIGRYEAAIARFEQALQIDPAFAEAHLDLAQALRQTGQTEKAGAHEREARRLRHGNSTARH